jgi:hypothetical protein
MYIHDHTTIGIGLTKYHSMIMEHALEIFGSNWTCQGWWITSANPHHPVSNHVGIVESSALPVRHVLQSCVKGGIAIATNHHV